MASISNSTVSRVVSAAGKLSGPTASTQVNLASSLDKSISRVSPRDVQAEAARAIRGDLTTDGVDRVAKVAAPTPTVPPVESPAEVNPSSCKEAAGVDEAATTTTLERGAKGEEVKALQEQLSSLGYDVGALDGDYGPRTEAAVRSFQLNNDLPLTGKADPATRDFLASADARSFDPNKSEFPTYAPGSPEQIALFEEAARQAGLPVEWASSAALQSLLEAESGGQVGRPNYTYGERSEDPSAWAAIHEELRNGDITAKSSATGLGQLLLSNVDQYYPSGREGIGDPTEEAIGMLRYIADRYGSPEEAWNQYNENFEGY
jgi:hypothetical protein